MTTKSVWLKVNDIWLQAIWRVRVLFFDAVLYVLWETKSIDEIVMTLCRINEWFLRHFWIYPYETAKTLYTKAEIILKDKSYQIRKVEFLVDFAQELAVTINQVSFRKHQCYQFYWQTLLS